MGCCGGERRVIATPDPGPIPVPIFPDRAQVLNFLADATAHGGGDGPITAATDLSGAGNLIVMGAAGQEMAYAAGRYGAGVAGATSTDGWLKVVVGGPIVNFLNGVAAGTKAFTIMMNFQQRVHIASSWVSWYNSALLSRHFTIRTNTSTYVPQVIGGTSVGAQPSISAPGTDVLFNRWHPFPMAYTFRTNGATDRHRIDGYDDTPVARAWAGNYACDTFAIGAGSTGGAFTRANNAIYKQVIIWDGELSDAQVLAVELAWGSQNPEALGWKANLGGTLSPGATRTKIFAMPGQSNNSGGCPGSPNYGAAAPGIKSLALDGIHKDLTEPSHNPTNAVTTPLVWLPAQIGPSKMVQFCSDLRAAGDTDDMLVVPRASPGSDASSWILNIATAPNMLNFGPFLFQAVAEALKAPSPDLYWILDQGEADCDTLAEAQGWKGKWDTFRAQANTTFGAYYTTPKVSRWYVSIMSNPIAGTGIFQTELRTDQAAFIAAWADVVGYQRNQGSCEAPIGLHLTGTEQQTNAGLESALFIASP